MSAGRRSKWVRVLALELVLVPLVVGGFHRDAGERLVELLAADERLADRPIDVVSVAHGASSSRSSSTRARCLRPGGVIAS